MMLRVEADGGSFKDPAGRVYRISGETGDVRIVRGLNHAAGEAVEKILAEPFFQELVAAGHVVKTEKLSREALNALDLGGKNMQAAVEHEPVDVVTWPYEWPFSMLKDAALLQLHLLEESLKNGWILKDATPFNIQWKGACPVFVDVPSFVPWEGEKYWRGYRQFSAMFLTPLLLTAHLGIPFQPLLRSRLEGVPPEEATRYFYGLRRFKRGVLSHIWFPAKVERHVHRRKGRQSTHVTGRGGGRIRSLSLLDSLKRLIAGLSYRADRSDWSRYNETHTYDGGDFDRKKNFVRRHTASHRPGLTWDLGANTGVFSRIAAHYSRTVVALDSDQGAIDCLYRETRRDGPQNVICLLMDLTNPSPEQGWAGHERSAFDDRSRPDMILCLALIHHIRISANIPIPLFLDWLRSFGAAVILEVVGREDEMVRKLLENKRENYEDYSIRNVEKAISSRFSVRDRLKLKGGSRVLLLLEPTCGI